MIVFNTKMTNILGCEITLAGVLIILVGLLIKKELVSLSLLLLLGIVSVIVFVIFSLFSAKIVFSEEGITINKRKPLTHLTTNNIDYCELKNIRITIAQVIKIVLEYQVDGVEQKSRFEVASSQIMEVAELWEMMLRKKITISFDQFPNHYPTKIESLVASMNWEAIRRKQKIYLIEDWFLIVGFLIGIVGALAAAIVSL